MTRFTTVSHHTIKKSVRNIWKKSPKKNLYKTKVFSERGFTQLDNFDFISLTLSKHFFAVIESPLL